MLPGSDPDQYGLRLSHVAP